MQRINTHKERSQIKIVGKREVKRNIERTVLWE